MKNVLMAACVCILSCSPKAVVMDHTSPPVFAFDFETSALLSPVLDKSALEKKPVFLDISAAWCAPCQLMKRDVYSHLPTADFFNDHFINYLVDAEKGEGPDLNLIFSVKVYPTLLILDEKGRILLRREGSAYHEELVKFGEEGLRLYALKN